MVNLRLMALAVVVALGGCLQATSSTGDSKIVCNPPYIRFADTCCLDLNHNNICDRDETSAPSAQIPSTLLPQTPIPQPKQTTPQEKPYTTQNDAKAGIPDLGIGANMNGFLPFPHDNPWNLDISGLPADPNSDSILAAIGVHPLHPDFGTEWEGTPMGMPYVVVSKDQPKVKVTFTYADESDNGPYPIPPDAPIEGGPQGNGDRHVLVIDRDNKMLYELYLAYPNKDGTWNADSGAIFNLSSNTLRPPFYTSADAAGLPIFPGLVRYDEVAVQKEIRHAIRFTLPKTRKAFVCPARHYASNIYDLNYLPMGARLRLKEGFDTTGYPEYVQVILRALKKYGMILADNGSPLFITGTHDERWNNDELNTLKNVKTTDFEVVRMPPATGPNDKPQPC